MNLRYFNILLGISVLVYELQQQPSMSVLQMDFKVMCENAMIYNKPDTIYHKAARKLLHSGMKVLSQVGSPMLSSYA